MSKYDSGTIAWAIASAMMVVAFMAMIAYASYQAQQGYNLRQKYLTEVGIENLQPFASNSGYDFYMVPK